MDNIAVIFSDKGAEIKHGINPADYAGRSDVLINPAYPRDAQGHVIPPHLWKLKEMQGTASKRSAKTQAYLIGFMSGILFSIGYCLLRKIL